MTAMIPLSWYLIFAAALFCIGLFGVLARKNAIAILMGIELMLNAVNLSIVSFGALTAKDRFRHPPAYGERRPTVVGPTFAVLFGMAFWTFAVVAAIALLR